MSVKKVLVAWWGMAMLAGHAWAIEDLLAVYRLAQVRDPAFAAARHQRDATAERLVQARAALRPSVSLSANTSRQEGETSFSGAPFVDRRVRSNSLALQLTQPLFRLTNDVAYEQAESQVRQSEQVFRQAQADLVLRVSQAYFDALVARESADVAHNQVNAVEQQLNLAQRNFQAGLTTITDLHEASSRFELARAQRIVAQTEVDIRNAELEKTLGYLPSRLARLRLDAKGPLPQPLQVQPWIDEALNSNPQIRGQQLAVDIAGLEVRKLNLAQLPTLDLTASTGRNFNSGSLSSPAEQGARFSSNQIALQFNLPLYTGGASTSRVREAVLLLSRAQAELESMRQQVTFQIRQAFTGIVNGRAQIEALSAAVVASKAAVDSNKIGYRIGTRINIDVLNAEQQLFATERDLYRIRADTIVQALRLKAAQGQLEEADLQSTNLLLTSTSLTKEP